ncbi:MAG: sulfatase [Myxococcota bacterium]|nr:sulfatase [Myxococcota bacterium]
MFPLLLATVSALSACTKDPEPLMVLVIVDTLRADALSFSGAPVKDASPAIQALKDESVWFSRAQASSSWTLPSTTSLLTGLPPWQHRVVREAENPACFGRLREDIPTLASVAKQRGDRSAAFINNAFLAPEFNLHLSFDVYDFHGAEATGHRTALETVKLALDWVDQAPEEGGVLVVHIMEPHTDYDPGPTWKGHYTDGMPTSLTLPIGSWKHSLWMTGQEVPSLEDQAFVRAAYQEEVRATDEAVGTLVQGLKDRGLWDRTTLVLTSDHGEAFWDRGSYEHGHTLMDEVTHVPLLVRAPGLEPGENQTLVDSTFPFMLLVDPTRENGAWALTKSGETDPQRLTLSQGILYGNQKASILTSEHRLVADLQPRSDGARYLRLYEVHDGVTAKVPLQPEHPAQQTVTPQLRNLLEQARGTLDPTPPTNAQGIETATVFQQLRAQGYLDGNDCQR